MGQYHYVVNITKREYLHPHNLGDGLKLLEFGPSGDGTMAALALLLSEDGKNQGGGDARRALEMVGRWARDTIVIAGDYGGPHGLDLSDTDKIDLRTAMDKEAGEPIPVDEIEGRIAKASLYELCGCDFFKNISEEMRGALKANDVDVRGSW